MKNKITPSLMITTLLISFMIVISCTSDDNINETRNLNPPLANVATAITDSSFKASWIHVYGAKSYQLDISRDPDFSSILPNYNGKVIAALQEEVTGLDNFTDYYYRVRAINDEKQSSYSNAIQLRTKFIPGEDLTLKSEATSFHVGVAVKSSELSGAYDEIISREFSSITSEYEMKMDIIQPAPDIYNWGPSDAIVDYAEENGLNIHGHALIWHLSVPDWINNFEGTNEEFEAIIETYITNVVTRYRGRVTSWDVVNEAVDDADGSLRNTIFRQRMGDNYIAKCFQFARNADPDVLLFYNDYSMATNPTKQDAVFDIIDNLMANDVPIDGVGFQMHVIYNDPSEESIQSATDRIVSRNLKVHFSELDIRANPGGDLTVLTPERAAAQRQKVEEIVRIYNNLPEVNKYALTLWGIKDDKSWLISKYDQPDWPLLFDASFNRKEAYNGFLEVLQ